MEIIVGEFDGRDLTRKISCVLITQIPTCVPDQRHESINLGVRSAHGDNLVFYIVPEVFYMFNELLEIHITLITEYS